MRSRCNALYLLGFFLVAVSGPVAAHESRPGYLKLTESGTNLYELIWRMPVLSGTAPAHLLGIQPVFPEDCSYTGSRRYQRSGNTLVESSQLQCQSPLPGRTVGIEGLERTIGNVFVTLSLGTGDYSLQLTASEPIQVLPEAPGTTDAGSYFAFGVEHFLTGTDHVLFVLALYLLSYNLSQLLIVITAFTLAHSLTLAAAALEFLRLSGPVVEAAIALSILFVAVEAALPESKRSVIAHRHPAVVAGLFGLVHGLGFAGVIGQIGLPASGTAWALLLFNLGLELGQLMLIFLLLVLAFSADGLARLRPIWTQGVVKMKARASSAALWVTGIAAAYWLFNRTTALFIAGVG
ncbi:MAG: HupE/UreJ family protein [Gammaproteobacteria bacterium]